MPFFLVSLARPPPLPTLFPYTTLFRSARLRCPPESCPICRPASFVSSTRSRASATICLSRRRSLRARSEEHTSELQSRGHLVCRLLLGKKKQRSMAKRRDYR